MIKSQPIGLLIFVFTWICACQPLNPITVPDSQVTGSESEFTIGSQNIQLTGKVEYPGNWRPQAELSNIPALATVALLNPDDHASAPGALVASGHSDLNGAFKLILPTKTLPTGSLFILEASRRFGSVGTQSVSLRNIVRWNGTDWNSISTPHLLLNTKTTALSLVAELDQAISAEAVLGRVSSTANSSQIPAPLGTHTIDQLNTLVSQITTLIEEDYDPIALIRYQEGEFYVAKPQNPQRTWLDQHNTCPDCELDHENLTGADLSNKDFSHADLSNAQLPQANLTLANLSEAILDGANLRKANLNQANLSQASLQGSQLQSSQFDQTQLTQSNLSHANLSGSDLRTAVLNQSNLSNANLQSAQLDGQDLTSLNIQNAQFTWASLVGTNFNSMNLSGLSFENANLTNANLSATNLSSINLKNSNLSGANLTGATLNQSLFTGAKLDGATWVNEKICESGSRSICRYEQLVNTTTSGDQQYHSVATSANGETVVAWNQGEAPFIRVQRFDANGLPRGGEISVSQELAANDSDTDIAIATDGSFVVVWDHYNGSNGYDSLARVYNADGSPKTDEFIVHQSTSGHQWLPNVAMAPEGHFTIVWTEASGRDGNGAGVYMRSFDPDAHASSDDELVNSQTNGHQHQGDIAMNKDYCVITYTDMSGADGSGNGVFGRLIRLADNYKYNTQQINVQSSGNQDMPSIAMRTDGRFVIAWVSASQDGDAAGIFARMFPLSLSNPTGTGISSGNSEFQVNTYTASDQIYPSVAMSGDGYFLISWHSQNQDGTPYAIYAQRYDYRFADKIGGEFQVDSLTSGSQMYPGVALANSRRASIAWASNDADGIGVAMKQFEF